MSSKKNDQNRTGRGRGGERRGGLGFTRRSPLFGMGGDWGGGVTSTGIPGWGKPLGGGGYKRRGGGNSGDAEDNS